MNSFSNNINFSKISVSLITLLLLIWTLVDGNLIHLGILAFSSLVTTMLHFHYFESTDDKHPLNRIDFVLQLLFIFAKHFADKEECSSNHHGINGGNAPLQQVCTGSAHYNTGNVEPVNGIFVKIAAEFFMVKEII